TPWGEIAWQLGGEAGWAVVAEHDRRGTAPGGDVIERMLPRDRPALVLLDELMNYVSRNRKSGLAAQLYAFLHSLSEAVRSRDNVVLAVSIPASELEMSAEDESDYGRFKKLLDRVGKAVLMSAEAETAEIIRRRLFEWEGLPKEAGATVRAYRQWLAAHRQQLPSWFPVDKADAELAACYPFHPSVLSVFERKWQGLPRFQRTRGILRLLALWVSRAYREGFEGAHRDPLITLGTAPLEDPTFRSAVFEQLGESRLEAAVTTDIAGRAGAHALRLDKEATPAARKARLHRKIATVVFFESNGGQQRGEATLPEIRLAVGEPALDIGIIEQGLEALADACYYLTATGNRYRFSFQPNLNKLLADRRATIPPRDIEERVRTEVQQVFNAGRNVERVFFPEQSNQVPDRPALTLVVLAPDRDARDPETPRFIETLTREAGASARTYKSALIWAVAEDGSALAEEARKLLAWEAIEEEAEDRNLDEAQRRQLTENIKRARRDLREAVWRAYKNLFLLDDTQGLRRIDLGLVHSSQADSLVSLILTRLRQEDLVADGVSPNFLVRQWPPALPEWSTRQVRDAFLASPKFPRLLNPEVVRETIARGVEAGLFAYVGKRGDGGYDPFRFEEPLRPEEVELSGEMFLIRREAAEAWKRTKQPVAGQAGAPVAPTTPPVTPPPGGTVPTPPAPAPAPAKPCGFRWQGELPPRKWMNFYTAMLSHWANSPHLRVRVHIEVDPAACVGESQLAVMGQALRELGLAETIERIRPAEGPEAKADEAG
ncbi:MAG: DUF499 domain-containing protein, partial [Verrucomicrobia bacterium]